MMRLAKLAATALFCVVVSTSGALAFHDGGVAECAGCHTMHNSQDGADPGLAGSFENLLLHDGATDTCLSCHAGYGQFAGGLGFGPGGDFYWVTKTFSWSAHGHTTESTGDSHGHNVVTATYGIAPDATLGTAPGGTFDASYLGCTSCHDPHGNQNFRILYGGNTDPFSPNGPLYIGESRYDFTAPAPVALGNSRKTNSDAGEETDSHHTIYISGMSDWCANCHTNFHSDVATDFVHKVDEQLNGLSGNYNAYVATGDMSGDQATAYWGLVPFEDVNALADSTTSDPANYTFGPASNDRVMCLSCHRSHASAFPDIARWDMGTTFIEESHPLDGDTGADPTDIERKYYEYTFTVDQRSLCNKCHVKDADDAPF